RATDELFCERKPEARAFHACRSDLFANPASLLLVLRPGERPATQGRIERVSKSAVDRIRRVRQIVERLDRKLPSMAHREAMDERVRLLDILEIPPAFHVRLPGEDPEIADDDVRDLGMLGDVSDAIAPAH